MADNKNDVIFFLGAGTLYTDFGVSYFIQTFVNKINTTLWNGCWVCLTNDFYYKADQNRAILATLDSLLDLG